LLILPWIVAVAALLVAGMALLRARRVARRADRLMESYWELRYEVGQLQARVDRLDPAQAIQAPEPSRGGPSVFIPVSSLKR